MAGHHQLPCNGTDAHLHGGLTGFGAREWTPVDQAGVQFYTGNGLHLPKGAKAERGYRRHAGFCLEAQGDPDAPNHRAFPDNDLGPGTVYRRVIGYRFETPGR